MKLIFLALLVSLIVAITASTVTAQEAVPQTDPLLAACAYALAVADSEGLVVRNCRKVSMQVDGVRAVVAVRLAIEGVGPYVITQHLYLTNWQSQTFRAEPAG